MKIPLDDDPLRLGNARLRARADEIYSGPLAASVRLHNVRLRLGLGHGTKEIVEADE